ncbi:amino acid ABC transporter substrate-binding protein [Azospirillum endophyticum]
MLLKPFPLRAMLGTALVALALLSAPATPALSQAADPPAAPVSSTMAAARERGAIRCGVSTGVAGFSMPGPDGQWRGFDVDFCRAAAAAVLGDAGKVVFVPATTAEGLRRLAAGDIDLLSRSTTITLSRLAAGGFQPVGISYYDGQGFLTRRALNVRTVRQMAGLSICFQRGTTSETNLAEHFRTLGIAYRPIPKGPLSEMIASYRSGECDVMTSDSAALAALRVMEMPDPDEHLVVRQRISKEPLGPLVRKGDDAWLEAMRWTLAAMIEAEELGVSHRNVEEMRHSEATRVLRLVGMVPGFGAPLGLDDSWAFRIIAQVGNYGDVFEATIGPKTPLKLERGLNELWTKGGLLIALPLR